MKTTPVESALGLQRTKGGRDDKQLAYLTSRDNVKRLGVSLIVVAFFILIYGVVLKQDLSWSTGATSALRKQAIREKQALFRSRMDVANNNNQAESKLVKILTILQDHLERDTEDKGALVDFQLSLGNQIKKHKRLIKREMKMLGGNKVSSSQLTNKCNKRIFKY
jgi:hypothetical protein